MSCRDFFQPFIDYLNQPTDPDRINRLDFLIAGNRSEANRFVLYIQGYLEKSTDTQLTGAAVQFFSDRTTSTSGPAQPFDVHQIEEINVSLSVPVGPLVFSTRDSGDLIEQFSSLECRDNGLLICTSDSERSILVVSFTESFLSLADF